LDTAIVLVAARSLSATRAALAAAGSSLVSLADAERHTLTIARTLGQHAAPSTVGAGVAAWLDAVSASIEGIDATDFPVQLGGAVGT
ncbi:lyase family protein, partial [Rhizobium johnstonii]|uniref:lyase family protein n=1 Tax=Rhizobium johnstonii TaxID=3019933 RepID=UPI003F9ADA4C